MKWSRPVSISVALLTLILLAVSALAAEDTPLQKAIKKGDIRKVTELLDKGANINEWNYGTPLIMAASTGRLEIVKLLIERGAESAFSSISRNVASSTNALVIRNADILFGLLEPVRQAHLDRADSLAAESHWGETLSEYAAAFRISNQAGREELLTKASVLLKSHPELAELPEEARKHSLRADMLVKEKDLRGAVKEYNQALDLAPFCPIIYYNQAVVLGNLKQYSQAVEHMEVYLILAPEDQKAREAKDLIYQWEFMLERQAGK